MWSENDYRYMARALQLARRGLFTTDPNPRVGCVLVKSDRIIAEGWHQSAGGPHAEISALANCTGSAAGSTCYVTLEPCAHTGRTPPCYPALIEAGVTRVVAALEDPNPKVAGDGMAGLAAAGIKVETGLLSDQAAVLNPGFLKRMREGRPYVRSKLAMSLDGRTSLADGQSRWITSGAARADVHRLRARSSAILTGTGTVLADDPRLTARLEDGHAARQPLRLVMDSQLRMPPTANILRQTGRTVIFTRSADHAATKLLQQAGAEVIRVAIDDHGEQLHAVLAMLAEDWAINELLVEAGPTLNGALLHAGLIDEMVIYMAPALLGDKAGGLFQLPLLERMQDRVGLQITDIRPVGNDWRITAVPEHGNED